MARPRKYIDRKAISDSLNENDVYYLLTGFIFLPSDDKEKYHKKMKRAWDLHKSDLMDWWHSSKQFSDLIPCKRYCDELPKEERIGNRPFFWWLGRERKFLSGYIPQSLGDITNRGIPSGYGGMTAKYPNGRGIRVDDPPVYESVYAYLKRTGELTEEEKKKLTNQPETEELWDSAPYKGDRETK
jgi:hypothetical protein